MSMHFHFSDRSVASRFAGRLKNHIVDLHEMVRWSREFAPGHTTAAKLARLRHHSVHLHEMMTAGMPLNHFSRMGKMVSLGADSQRAVQLSVPEPRSTRVASTVGVPLMKPALRQTVPPFPRTQSLRRVAQGVAWEQKGGEG